MRAVLLTLMNFCVKIYKNKIIGRNKVKTFLSILICRITYFFLKITGRGGTTLPGRMALKIKPDILKDVSKNVKIVLVTGTNGKTTSCRILEQMFIDAKKSYFINKSGANLITGITTSFILNSTATGKNKKEYAIVECDENAFKKVSLYLKPQVVLVTNIFRDQLDRYGEVTHTLSAIRESISHLPDSTLCLCTDCSLTYSLSRDFPNNKIFTYGVNLPFDENSSETNVSDAEYCIFCKTKYEYNYHTFGHLGGYYCPNCGYKRVTPDVAVEKIIEIKSDYSVVDLNIFGEIFETKINVPGTYNIYNAAGAALALKCLGFEPKSIVKTISEFSSAFGRMEKFTFGCHNINMILVKNPAGFTQVTAHLSRVTNDFAVIFCLNDNAADGKDVSWIWDVHFHNLFESPYLKKVYTCGKRAYDMALLLKYNGYDENNITVIENEDYDKEIEFIIEECKNKDVFIVPTYTSMMQQRHKIAARFGGKEFWE